MAETKEENIRRRIKRAILEHEPYQDDCFNELDCANPDHLAEEIYPIFEAETGDVIAKDRLKVTFLALFTSGGAMAQTLSKDEFKKLAELVSAL